MKQLFALYGRVDALKTKLIMVMLQQFGTTLWMSRQSIKMTANGWMTAGEEMSTTAALLHTPGAERAESMQMAIWLGKTT